MSRAARIGVWVLSIFLAFVFVMAGLPKLQGVPGHVRAFAHWGYPDWFRIVVGVIEFAAGVLLLVPRLAFFGALGIATIMAGATYTHVVRVPAEAGRAPFTLTLLALAALVAYARRPRVPATGPQATLETTRDGPS